MSLENAVTHCACDIVNGEDHRDLAAVVAAPCAMAPPLPS